MTELSNGGPAFPLSVAVGPAGDLYDSSQAASGMSLRDWFAGQALTGILMADELARAQINPGGRYTTGPEFSKAAYKMADAMIAERDKDTP